MIACHTAAAMTMVRHGLVYTDAVELSSIRVLRTNMALSESCCTGSNQPCNELRGDWIVAANSSVLRRTGSRPPIQQAPNCCTNRLMIINNQRIGSVSSGIGEERAREAAAPQDISLIESTVTHQTKTDRMEFGRWHSSTNFRCWCSQSCSCCRAANRDLHQTLGNSPRCRTWHSMNELP